MDSESRAIWIVMSGAVLMAATALIWVVRAIASDSHQPITAPPASGSGIYDFRVRDIDGQEVDLAAYRGKALLIVNTASKCGFTPQYAGLEQLYEKYRDRGFEILAFPANNFMGQEPGTDAEIKQFCELRFKTTFPLFSKISVKGSDIHPLYRYLTTQSGFGGDISWNFNKFVVAPDGRVTARFGSRQDPMSPDVVKAVEAAIAESAAPGPAAAN